jgi:tetratricopeptide (TPR) repeat protein
MARVIELATAANARAPDDVAAMRLFSVALAARADAAREESPLAGGELLEDALAVARRAAETHSGDDEVQVLLTERLVGLAASLRARGLEERAVPLLEEARTRSKQLLHRSPGHVAARQALVAIEFELGHFTAAWQLARELEAQSQVARVRRAAFAALLAGQFDDAVRLARRAEGRATPRLVNALAEALSERPAEAVVQARALRGHMPQVEWPKGLAGDALKGLAAHGAAGAAALALGYALDEGADRDEALEAFILSLEATLPHR